MSSVRRRSFVLAVATAAALAMAPPADARRTIKLRVHRFVVPPNSNREVCTLVPVPMSKPFDLSGSVIVNLGGDELSFTTHHFLMWVYQGKDVDRFPPKGQIVVMKPGGGACLDFGPADTNQRTLIGGAQQPRLETRLPAGLAQQITPVASGGRSVAAIILNSHWINGGARPRKAAVKVTLMAAPKHSVHQFVLPLFDVVANGFIKVPPDQVQSVKWAWQPGGTDYGGGIGGGAYPTGPACVTSLTSHMHKRGTLFTIDFLDGNTVVPCPQNPQPNGTCLTATDYAHPPQIPFVPPLLVNVGQGLRYTCTHDNGVTRSIKMGCEEQAGVPPGDRGTAALPPSSRRAGWAARPGSAGARTGSSPRSSGAGRPRGGGPSRARRSSTPRPRSCARAASAGRRSSPAPRRTPRASRGRASRCRGGRARGCRSRRRRVRLPTRPPGAATTPPGGGRSPSPRGGASTPAAARPGGAGRRPARPTSPSRGRR